MQQSPSLKVCPRCSKGRLGRRLDEAVDQCYNCGYIVYPPVNIEQEKPILVRKDEELESGQVSFPFKLIRDKGRHFRTAPGLWVLSQESETVLIVVSYTSSKRKSSRLAIAQSINTVPEGYDFPQTDIFLKIIADLFIERTKLRLWGLRQLLTGR